MPASLFLSRLFVKDLRNISETTCHFNHGHHLFVGANGQGKTNMLEAIALACSLKPMQALHNHDLLRFGTTQAKVMGQFKGDEHLDIEIDIFSQGKKAKINNRIVTRLTQLSSLCSVVSFIPAELNLISGPQNLRRRLIDQISAHIFAEHAIAIKNYEKILQHRNRLLKDWPIDKTLLATFTNMLITEAAKIIDARKNTIRIISETFADYIREILGPSFTASIAYREQEQNLNLLEWQTLINKERYHVAAAELQRRITLFGPHLDDVNFMFNHHNAKSSVSRGQSRALVIACKLAHMSTITRLRGHAPIIILDDIVSELDNNVKANLISAINMLDTQAFFSATDQKVFGKHIPIDHILDVQEGQIVMATHD